MKNTKSTTDPNYSELAGELDELLANLEAGELDIDEALSCYERGLVIIKQLETKLLSAENRLTELQLNEPPASS